MHSSFSARGVQRRRLLGAGAGSGRSTGILSLTIDSAATNALRQLLSPLCRDSMSFMRVASRSEAGKTKVWLCVCDGTEGALTAAVPRSFPTARLGRMANDGEQVFS